MYTIPRVFGKTSRSPEMNQQTHSKMPQMPQRSLKQVADGADDLPTAPDIDTGRIRVGKMARSMC